jgi:hypothetical protein
MSKSIPRCFTARLLLCAKHNTGARTSRLPVKGHWCGRWQPSQRCGCHSWNWHCFRLPPHYHRTGRDCSEQNRALGTPQEICGFFSRLRRVSLQRRRQLRSRPDISWFHLPEPIGSYRRAARAWGARHEHQRAYLAIEAWAAAIFAFTASRLKLAPFCIGGNSIAVIASFSTCC